MLFVVHGRLPALGVQAPFRGAGGIGSRPANTVEHAVFSMLLAVRRRLAALTNTVRLPRAGVVRALPHFGRARGR